jgi:hypothetical protein
MNILGYIEVNDFDALALFMCSGFLMSYFSKNMIVILLTAMFFGNCKVCASALNVREGFKEGAGKKGSMSDKAKKATNTTIYYVGLKNRKATCMPVGAAGNNATCKKGTLVPKGSGKSICFSIKEWGTKCGKQAKPKKKKSGFSQRSNPANLDASKQDEGVDYGAALDTAFNTLSNMTGNNGIANMANTTADLVDTQHKLMESITNMGPTIQSAKETLDNMKLPDMNKMSEFLTRMNSGRDSGLMTD